MKKLINCLFLFFLAASSSAAQTVSSKVVDKESKQPLHYATVAIKDTGKGVITNEDGLFSITIKDTSYSIIVISYLGYKTLELNSKNIPSVIYLQEDVKSLQTITVSAYTPITILRKAFERIEENYPQDLTKQIGFYRQHSFTGAEDLVYISEGVVEIVKSKYKKKFKNDFGQLKVLKGRTNYFSHHDWASKTGFTGGHLYWNRFDIAKKRMDFINPKHFDEYDYVLRASSVQDGRVVYIISFDNRNGQLKGEWEGTLYIDSESFAYMGADAKGTAIGIKKRNRKEGNEIHNWKEFGFEIRYKKIKERWHLNSNIYTLSFCI